MAHNEPEAAVGEADEYETEDSGYYEDISLLTASVRSSVYEYRYENGRRYHAYKEGSYYMPNDEPEQERLNLQHHASYLALQRRDFLAPLSGARRILDLGTGTGIWAIDMGDNFPDAEILGVDLSPIQPNSVPPNVKFEVDDVEDNWTFHENSFDLIFSRDMLAGSIANARKYVEQAYRHCTPGGYFEVHELNINVCSDHYTIPEDSSIMEWCALMRQGIQVMGRQLDLNFDEIANLLREVGFEDVTVMPYKQPIGQWPSDPAMKQSGAVQLVALLEGLESMSLAIFMRCLQWSKEDVEALLERTKREFTLRRTCYYRPGVVIYARKPQPQPRPP